MWILLVSEYYSLTSFGIKAENTSPNAMQLIIFSGERNFIVKGEIFNNYRMDHLWTRVARSVQQNQAKWYSKLKKNKKYNIPK